MGISQADTANNPRYFRFVCKKTAHFDNASIMREACTAGEHFLRLSRSDRRCIEINLSRFGARGNAAHVLAPTP